MNYFLLILTAISLAMDAFAVSICKGLSIKKTNIKVYLIIGFYFGLFQTIMPMIGYFLTYNFRDLIMIIDHWIVFVILGIIGINMILETYKEDFESIDDKIDFKTMIVLAIATSIDALAVGVSFAFLNLNIISASLIIGLITFCICVIGVKIGSMFGNRYEKKAQLFGGIILFLIGLKILIEHLFF